jgi:DNA mismatch endonuclease (patch repair protein)
VDIVSPARRSELMSRIRAKDTKPEIAVRSVAHALGFRFRLHHRGLPGRPDLVFPRLRKVVFVHGCFWHRHPRCQFAYAPKSNTKFWRQKFSANVRRDRLAIQTLKEQGWQVLIVWQCQTSNIEALRQRLASYLQTGAARRSVHGT